MTAFAEIADDISDICDDLFGEGFEFRPMAGADANARIGNDSTRAGRTVTAIFAEPALVMPELGHRVASKGFIGKAIETITEPSLSVQEHQFDAEAPPRRLDRFKRIATGFLYSVEDVHPDGGGRLVVTLADLGVEA